MEKRLIFILYITLYPVLSVKVGKWGLYHNLETCNYEQTPLAQLMDGASMLGSRFATDRLNCLQRCAGNSQCGSTSLSMEAGLGTCVLLDRDVYACDENNGIYTKMRSNHCSNGGTWVNMTHCECPFGWAGPFCDYDNPDECASTPCNDGDCIDYISGYTCVCHSGFCGVYCEVNIDECVSSPCGPYGTCIDGVNGYTCSCNPGYSGIHCEVNINECSSNPCGSYGSCNDAVNGYTCSCVSSYHGTFCQDYIECSSNPCVYGTCTNGGSYYSCSCYTGYAGTNCQTEVSDEVRLSNTYYGLLQVYYNGQWGTVCDDIFDTNSNGCTVVCRMLGYTYGIHSECGSGGDPIWLDDVNCLGTESTLDQCPHSAYGSHNCGHTEDSGCYCCNTPSACTGC